MASTLEDTNTGTGLRSKCEQFKPLNSSEPQVVVALNLSGNSSATRMKAKKFRRIARKMEGFWSCTTRYNCYKLRKDCMTYCAQRARVLWDTKNGRRLHRSWRFQNRALRHIYMSKCAHVSRWASGWTGRWVTRSLMSRFDAPVSSETKKNTRKKWPVAPVVVSSSATGRNTLTISSSASPSYSSSLSVQKYENESYKVCSIPCEVYATHSDGI